MDGERVDVKVNKLTSTVTQLPYDYYRLPFCKPTELKYSVENLGEVLQAPSRTAVRLYAQKSDFKVLCKVTLTKKESKLLASRIKEDYRVQMIMDNLPAATRMISELPDGKTVTMYDRGYRLGFLGAKEFPGTTPKTPYLNNHLRFIIKYHKDEKFEGARIVGFSGGLQRASQVQGHVGQGRAIDVGAASRTYRLSPSIPKRVAAHIFTYDVTWRSPQYDGPQDGICTSHGR